MHPSNDELAALFVEAAELLAIQGGEPHRARAFRRAARALEQLAEPAPRLVPLGQLARVRGIGEGTIRRIVPSPTPRTLASWPSGSRRGAGSASCSSARAARRNARARCGSPPWIARSSAASTNSAASSSFDGCATAQQ